jgi:putative acetyltransferase
MTEISIAVEPPDQPEVIALLDASDVYAAALYPAESNHMSSLDELLDENVRFLVARVDGQICGCAALVRKAEDWGEIKRMFVDENVRGLSLGKKLVAALEDQARELGLTTVRLETGIYQPAAIGLYHKADYVDVPPYGEYQEDHYSVFMEKQLR